MPGDRPHDVSGLTDAELERARRDLQVSLALAFPGSPVRAPILAEMTAIDAELAARPAVKGGRCPTRAPTGAWPRCCAIRSPAA
jgi:hypothetical protein